MLMFAVASVFMSFLWFNGLERMCLRKFPVMLKFLYLWNKIFGSNWKRKNNSKKLLIKFDTDCQNEIFKAIKKYERIFFKFLQINLNLKVFFWKLLKCLINIFFYFENLFKCSLWIIQLKIYFIFELKFFYIFNWFSFP